MAHGTGLIPNETHFPGQTRVAFLLCTLLHCSLAEKAFLSWTQGNGVPGLPMPRSLEHFPGTSPPPPSFQRGSFVRNCKPDAEGSRNQRQRH